MPKLSIITICYNEPDLEETCKSIVNQTWQDFEWIVIDGGSGEETQKIFDKYKYRIDKFISEPDNGIYNAYNKGIKLSNCEYVIFLNAGDMFYSNDVLALANSLFLKDDDILYGISEISYKSNKKNDSFFHYPKTISNKFFLEGNINTQCMFVKTELFRKYGFFDENYKICADYDRWIHFINEGARFRHIPIMVASYDYNGVSSKARKSLKAEMLAIKYKYFSKKEVLDYENNYIQKIYKKLTFPQQIFSICNSFNHIYKIYTIFGFHIKIKREIG